MWNQGSRIVVVGSRTQHRDFVAFLYVLFTFLYIFKRENVKSLWTSEALAVQGCVFRVSSFDWRFFIGVRERQGAPAVQGYVSGVSSFGWRFVLGVCGHWGHSPFRGGCVFRDMLVSTSYLSSTNKHCLPWIWYVAIVREVSYNRVRVSPEISWSALCKKSKMKQLVEAWAIIHTQPYVTAGGGGFGPNLF